VISISPKPFFSVGSINLDFYQFDSGVQTFLGGSACTTAHFLSNLLNPKEYALHLVGLIGSDENGKQILTQFQHKNFDSSKVKIWNGVSGSSVIVLDDRCERSITRLKSVNANLSEYLKEQEIQETLKAQLIHLKGSREALGILFEINPQIFSADLSGIINGIEPKDFQQWIKNIIGKGSIEFLTANEEEWSLLAYLIGFTDTKDHFLKDTIDPQTEIIRGMLKVFHSKVACIKRGKKGASVISETEVYHAKAFPVKVVDTTGAGDAFNAGFICAYLMRLPIKECVIHATALGSLKCTVLGAQSVQISFPELKSFIEKHRNEI